MPQLWQRRFVSRVEAFVDRKHFDGQNGFLINREVEIAIAASAVQLTLGLEEWDLSYFRSILMFEADYRNPATGQWHKGETNMSGFMCFSWKAFQEGNADPHDKINLGLHEFAHALRFNGVKGDACDYFFTHYFPRWLACAESEFHKLKNNIPGSIFRKYGGVNIEEFFSVSVETFFETPLEFKEALPDLYLHTSILLNQTFREDGSVWPGCREELMKTSGFALSADYAQAISLKTWHGILAIPAVLFGAGGLAGFIASGLGSLYPYVCVAAALLLYLVLEKNATRTAFHKEHLLVRKGFLTSRQYEIPYAQLISLNFSATKFLALVYFRDGFFYQESMRVHANDPLLDRLCTELKTQRVPVALAGE